MLKSIVLALSCVVLLCAFLVQNATSTEPDTSKRSVGSDNRSSAAAQPKLESLQVEPSFMVLQTARDPQSVVVTALPVIASIEGSRQIIVSGARQTLGLDIAVGTRLWWVDGATERVVCTPSIGLGHIFSFGGSPDVRAFAVRQGVLFRRQRTMHGDCQQSKL